MFAPSTGPIWPTCVKSVGGMGGGHCEVAHLAPWMSDAPMMVSKKIAQDLILYAWRVNDLISALAVAIMSVDPSMQLTPPQAALHINALWTRAGMTISVLQPLRQRLCELPLRRSMSMVIHWAQNTKVLADQMMNILLRSACESMMVASSLVDSACPRWGAFVTDKEVVDELARIQMVENPQVATLPKLVRSLAQQMGQVSKVYEIFQLPAPAQHEVSRGAIRISKNSFAFGKRTVNIAAALRLLFQPPHVARQSIDVVLGFKRVLLAGLLSRLEALKAGGPPGGGKKKKADASPAKPASPKEESSSGSCVKRPRMS